jgi:hypothetical protein
LHNNLKDSLARPQLHQQLHQLHLQLHLQQLDLEPPENVLPAALQSLQAPGQSRRPFSEPSKPKGSQVLPAHLFRDESRSPYFSSISPLDSFFDLKQQIQIHDHFYHDDPRQNLNFHALLK